MPRPAYGDGPWGEAIRYWLTVQKLRQADLVRLVRQLDPKDRTTPNTISNATRGFHTTTRILEKIARALHVPNDAVLVSPERKLANEDRKRLALEIAENVLRVMDSGVPLDPSPKTLDEAYAMIQRSIEREAAHTPDRHATLAAKGVKRTVSERPRLRKK